MYADVHVTRCSSDHRSRKRARWTASGRTCSRRPPQSKRLSRRPPTTGIRSGRGTSWSTSAISQGFRQVDQDRAGDRRWDQPLRRTTTSRQPNSPRIGSPTNRDGASDRDQPGDGHAPQCQRISCGGVSPAAAPCRRMTGWPCGPRRGRATPRRTGRRGLPAECVRRRACRCGHPGWALRVADAYWRSLSLGTACSAMAVRGHLPR